MKNEGNAAPVFRHAFESSLWISILSCRRKAHFCVSAIKYPQHDSLSNHYHISHRAGCAVLFDKDTLYPDVRVSSVYNHDLKIEHQIVREGEVGWVFQAVMSRAAFRRVFRNGQCDFTMMSLHIHNAYAKKR